MKIEKEPEMKFQQTFKASLLPWLILLPVMALAGSVLLTSETGTIPNARLSTFYPDDPLWDGEGCGSGHSCECELNSPP
jgi:hypothetical protein